MNITKTQLQEELAKITKKLATTENKAERLAEQLKQAKDDYAELQSIATAMEARISKLSKKLKKKR